MAKRTLTEAARAGYRQQIARTENRVKALLARRGWTLASKRIKGAVHYARVRCGAGHLLVLRVSHLLERKSCMLCVAAAARARMLAQAAGIAKRRGGELLSDRYVSARSPLQWLCGKGHTWRGCLDNVKRRGSWCPECEYARRSLRKKAWHRRQRRLRSRLRAAGAE